MRVWLGVVLAVIAGCVKPSNTFTCQDSSQCSGGTCEPTGSCSFPDATCPGGSRYDDTAGGGLANTCVGDPSNPDAGTADAPQDGTLAAACGNDQMDPGEDCDDGNTMDGDSCNSICLDCSGAATIVVGTHCYFRIDAVLNHLDARNDCEARGGHLVTYESAAENMIGTDLVTGQTGTFWIGLDDFGGNGFQWDDGTPLTFMNFIPGEPDDPGVSRCVDMTTAGLWGDEVCSRTHAYLCEREKP